MLHNSRSPHVPQLEKSLWATLKTYCSWEKVKKKKEASQHRTKINLPQLLTNSTRGVQTKRLS